MLNIVIPMAGHGSRFQKAGYELPKPLIPVHGVPMITAVINNLRPRCPHRFHFLCQASHLSEFNLSSILQDAAPDCQIRPIERVTEGAACTVLLASDWIDNESPLMIANCDQWIDSSIDDYLLAGQRSGADGFLMTMSDDSPKWSYVARDADGKISGVVEKQVVSNEATVGVYNFARGKDFVSNAKAMIRDEERSKGEFYVAPVYSRLITSGGQVEAVSVGEAGGVMHGLGTPDDLQRFLKKGFDQQIELASNSNGSRPTRRAA